MQINYLNKDEKDRTRPMWERIFSEDTEQFLDYYYKEKNRDNEILILSEKEKDVSMLHLNPYKLHIGCGEAVCSYIVAVATKPEYRHRGYMAALLRESFRHMYERKEPFTFLMPADEAIYLPFDFRFVYDQEKKIVTGRSSEKWSFRRAGELPQEEDTIGELPLESDVELFGDLAREILKEADVAAVRDAAYYRRQLLEQKSENGGIMIAENHNIPVGFFLFGNEGGYEIMEPLLKTSEKSKSEGIGRQEYEDYLQECVYSLTNDEDTEVTCHGLFYPGDQAEPAIMARIIHLESLFELLEPVCDFRMEIAVTDPIIKENEGVFRVSASRGRISAEKVRGQIGDTVSYSVSELIQILFGYQGRADFASFLKPLSSVFLNEVV